MHLPGDGRPVYLDVGPLHLDGGYPLKGPKITQNKGKSAFLGLFFTILGHFRGDLAN